MGLPAAILEELLPQQIIGLGFCPRYNELTKMIQNGNEPWEDAYDSLLHIKLKDIANPRYIDDTVKSMAWKERFHPVKDWVDAVLPWNGKDWIHQLCQYFENPDGMFETCLKKWMIGAIDRVYRGGTRNPMLVLDGLQQSGKSKFVRWLCPPELVEHYFREGMIRPEDKDHRLALIWTFIWEIGEIDATTKRADASALKDFITISTVKERGAYEKRASEQKTVTSFIGTFNDVIGFLTDPTGNTRYRVCRLKKINWIGYTTDPDDLQSLIWQQAIALWKAGETNELSPEEQKRMDQINSQYVLENNTRNAIEEYFDIDPENEDWFCSSEQIRVVLQNHGLHGADLDPRRVAACLMEKGCRKSRPMTDKIRKRGWYGVSKKLTA